jgi:O-antigen ligase
MQLQQQTTEKLKKIARYLLLAIAVTPLLYVNGWYYPFIVPKVLFFRTIIEVVLALTLLLWSTNALRIDTSIFKRWYGVLPLVFLITSSLSAIFGIDPYHSFWSSFSRMDGILTLLHVVIFFYLILFFFRDKEWNLFFKITVVTGILSALYALGQKAGLPFITRSGIARVEGTIGNASFLASYLGIIFFLTIRWLRQVRKGSPWYFFLIAGIGVELLAIYFTETRGTILALLGALVIFLIYKAKEGKGRIRSLSVGILIFIVLFGALGYVNRAKLLESKFALVQRLASAATLEDVTTRSRLFIWKESLAHVGEHPLLGVGMENFEYVYNGFYDPQIITEEWFDRSHNVYVDNLIQNGVVGLAVYLSVLGGAFYFAYRLFKEKGAGEYLFFLLLVTYAVQNFFVFDTISTFFLFFVVYAYLIRAHFNEKEIAAPRPVFLQYGLLLGALLIIISGYWWNILPLRANRALAKGYVYQLVDVPLSNKTFKEGLALGTFANLEYGSGCEATPRAVVFPRITWCLHEPLLAPRVGPERVRPMRTA